MNEGTHNLAQITKNFGYAGEDSYFTCYQPNLSVLSIGVADGVGSWMPQKQTEAASYAQALMKASQKYCQSLRWENFFFAFFLLCVVLCTCYLFFCAVFFCNAFATIIFCVLYKHFVVASKNFRSFIFLKCKKNCQWYAGVFLLITWHSYKSRLLAQIRNCC